AVDSLCEELRGRGLPVWIGNVNASTQFVLTGTAPAVEAALSALAPRALRVLPLGMNWPIHSELMAPAAGAVAGGAVPGRPTRPAETPFSGPAGTRAGDASDIRRFLGTEFLHPTLWNSTIEAMARDGHRSFLEVGPGDMLSRMTRWIDRTVSCT